MPQSLKDSMVLRTERILRPTGARGRMTGKQRDTRLVALGYCKIEWAVWLRATVRGLRGIAQPRKRKFQIGKRDQPMTYFWFAWPSSAQQSRISRDRFSLITKKSDSPQFAGMLKALKYLSSHRKVACETVVVMIVKQTTTCSSKS